MVKTQPSVESSRAYMNSFSHKCKNIILIVGFLNLINNYYNSSSSSDVSSPGDGSSSSIMVDEEAMDIS